MDDFLSLGLSDYAPPPPPPPPRIRSRKVFGQLVFLVLVLLSAGAGALGGLVFVHSANLPQVRHLMEFRPDVMTELYADDGTLVGSFALERRVIVNYDQIPKVQKDAVISVEDRHFESHWGVDVLRIVRAAIVDIIEWRRAQGASTLTQQLSRMLFLSPEKSFRRKFQEVLLAIQLERHFTKPQIFTLYANQVPLGHGTFGFEAAAQFYYGKTLSQLALPEAALLAGLPRSPTANSPLLHPERALRRRNIVLDLMLENRKITRQQHGQARAAPLGLNVQRWDNSTAPYFVEDVRQFLERKYGTEAVHEKGLRVYTTLNLRLQRIAEQTLREGLHAYDKRHGWRGPVLNISEKRAALPDGSQATLATYTHSDWGKSFQAGARAHGLVTDVKPDHALVRFGDFTARLTPGDFAWTGKSALREVFAPGDVDLFLIKEIRGHTLRVSLDQRPEAQGGLVAIENSTGAVKAMVGGYDFEESKFNRARQAARQAGSSFKPYLYAAVLMDGASPFDTILDAPVSYTTASGVWSPHNYDYKYRGTITLLRALAESRNIPAVRLLSRVGVDKVIKLCRKFGITSRLVPNLPLALGASDLTLLEHTSAFTTFPNDGVHISPRMIFRVTNYDGRVIDEFAPEITDVLPASVARIEVSMLREVVNSGTSTRAKALGRPVAGKTGTTNDFADAAFIGFTPSLTAGVWVGYDDRRSLGNKEEGGRLALPIWIDFMGEALKGQPVEDFPHSPLLTKPEQVQEIIASAGMERLLAARVEDAAPGGDLPPAATLKITGQSAAPAPIPKSASPDPAQSAQPAPPAGEAKPADPQRTSALPAATAPATQSSAPN
ncbi:MAG: PBP1A family penicillin-binding protein [Acidobacteria bacterium]|nr:PBP1A family penicillin-binding protein [Acidobacteriota bacterium]